MSPQERAQVERERREAHRDLERVIAGFHARYEWRWGRLVQARMFEASEGAALPAPGPASRVIGE